MYIGIEKVVQPSCQCDQNLKMNGSKPNVKLSLDFYSSLPLVQGHVVSEMVAYVHAVFEPTCKSFQWHKDRALALCSRELEFDSLCGKWLMLIMVGWLLRGLDSTLSCA
ncbi:hypothetical protein CDAR_585771 [Caerostris darwini]|uniref:Uncharacterized protein n=1 Tax=Caerostris darwini TaxID=1538125 RepID=A0AAV4TJ61_9ARAC|nr:hypothetical protein CDAR_585771 [Caerostris darwini]